MNHVLRIALLSPCTQTKTPCMIFIRSVALELFFFGLLNNNVMIKLHMQTSISLEPTDGDKS